MISNLLDIDEAILNHALQGEDSAAIFYDFAAAFPSIEQEFFHQFLQRLGWPKWLLNFVHSLYWNNFCSICLSGQRYTGFSISRGIRQGCPLSPLLFAMATDLMLRRLSKEFPTACTRAWADDLAMVIGNLKGNIHGLQNFFLDFAKISGLHLNVEKTVVVPLSVYEETKIRNLIGSRAPDFGGVKIATSAKYLGLFVGPGKGILSWQEPLEKYLDRARTWGKQGIGMLLSLQAYQVYVSSVLQFVLQLEDLPENFAEQERRACRALLPGPMGWMVPSCLKDARHFGFPMELMDMDAVALAAKARVVFFENKEHGGLDTTRRAARFPTTAADECSLQHVGWINTWSRNSFFFTLERARNTYRDRCSRDSVEARGRDEQQGWQRNATQILRSVPKGISTTRLRRCLERWKIQVLHGHRVGRAMRVMVEVGRTSSPRVMAAYLRTICNGWCTKRRYQSHGLCAFDCGGGEDSLEHFARCPKVRSMIGACSEWQLTTGPAALDDFSILHEGAVNEMPRKADCLYALYRLHNGIRHGLFQATDHQGAFHRFLREVEH